MPANPVTDEMVEKAARAICLAEGYDPKELDTIGSYSHQELWKDGRPKARAALEAVLADHVVVPKAAENDVRLAVARSIGRTAGETNHMVRADDAIRAMISATPAPAKQEAAE